MEHETIEEVYDEIENQYQYMCHESRTGGAATIDEVANVLASMSKLAFLVKEISKKVLP